MSDSSFFHELTFFNNKITSEEWKKFFFEIERYLQNYDINIILSGNLLKFYLLAKRDISAVTSQIFPMNLKSIDATSVDFKKFEYAKSTFKLPFFSGDITKFISNVILKEGINTLEIDIKMSKFIPQKGKMLTLKFIRNDKALKTKYWLKDFLPDFLSFDLTNNVIFNVEKAKAELKDTFIPSSSLNNSGIFSRSGQRFDLSNFDFFKHSLVVGQSGSGKSFFIENFIKELNTLNSANEYAVLLIDPHGNLKDQLSGIKSKFTLDFENTFVDIFSTKSDALLSSELSMSLITSMIEKSPDITSLERVLKFSLFTLFKNKQMSINNLLRLLKDLDFRKQQVDYAASDNVSTFFETEFPEYISQRYSSAILPIINFVTELQLINIQEGQKYSLGDYINSNFLTIVSIPQIKFGEKSVKMIGGSLLQQAFILAQSGQLNKKLMLIVDEFALMQNPSISTILSQSRKFGLSLMITQQYVNQVHTEILNSIYSNIVNYFIFKVDRDDAERMTHLLNVEIKDVYLKNKDDQREASEKAIEILSTLAIGECVMRVMKNGEYLSPFKVRIIMV